MLALKLWGYVSCEYSRYVDSRRQHIGVPIHSLSRRVICFTLGSGRDFESDSNGGSRPGNRYGAGRTTGFSEHTRGGFFLQAEIVSLLVMVLLSAGLGGMEKEPSYSHSIRVAMG